MEREPRQANDLSQPPSSPQLEVSPSQTQSIDSIRAAETAMLGLVDREPGIGCLELRKRVAERPKDWTNVSLAFWRLLNHQRMILTRQATVEPIPKDDSQPSSTLNG